MQDRDTIDRRTFTRRTAAVTGAIALAGCVGGEEPGDGDETGDGDGNGDDDVAAVPELPEIEDPPDAVYVPTHREAMRMLEPIDAGEFRLAPMLSYPTRSGDRGRRERRRGGRTNRPRRRPRRPHDVYPLGRRDGYRAPGRRGTQITIYRDDEQVGSPIPVGDDLSGDGLSLRRQRFAPGRRNVHRRGHHHPVSTTKTGDLEGRLEERQTATFEFVYDDEFRHEVVGGVEYLDEDDWGRRGALGPMDHGHGEGGHAHGEEHGDGHHDDGHQHGDGDGHHDDGHQHGDEHRDDGGHDDHDHHHVPYPNCRT